MPNNSTDSPRPLKVVISPVPPGEQINDRWPVTVDIDWIVTEYVNNKPEPSTLADADIYIGTDFNVAMGKAAKSLKAILKYGHVTLTFQSAKKPFGFYKNYNEITCV